MLVKVNGTESLYSRSIDNPSAFRERKHLGKRGGVHTRIVRMSEIEPVLNSRSGNNAFIIVDFPTPEFPENSDILSFKRSRNSVMPSP